MAKAVSQNQHRAALLEANNAAIGRIRGAVSAVPPEAMVRPPVTGGWSIAEVLEHLIVAADSYLEMLRPVISEGTALASMAAQPGSPPSWVVFSRQACGTSASFPRPGCTSRVPTPRPCARGVPESAGRSGTNHRRRGRHGLAPRPSPVSRPALAAHEPRRRVDGARRSRPAARWADRARQGSSASGGNRRNKVKAVITGAHSIIYSTNPEADRAFFRDVLELPNVDVGGGWLIFGLPPAEVAVHPSEENDVHELYLMCDDIQALVAAMAKRGVRCGAIEDQGWGILTHIVLPGGGKVGIDQPRHARPPAVSS